MKDLVIFSDIKLDDKLAIALAIARNQYDKYVIILSSFINFDKKSIDLVNFLNTIKNGKLVSPKLKLLCGTAPGWNSITNDLIAGSFDDINNIIAPGSVIDVLQIAPNSMTTFHKLAKLYEIENFHLVHGHNSQQPFQDKNLNNNVIQLKWLQSVKNYVHNTPIFTNNFASFSPPGSGSSQSYCDLLPFVPKSHLDDACYDPFHQRILRKIHDALIKSKVYTNCPRLIPPGYQDKDLGKCILQARKGLSNTEKLLRKHFSNYIQAVEKYLDDPRLIRLIDEKNRLRCKSVLKNAFSPTENGLKLEICDANNYILVEHTRDTNDYHLQPIKCVLKNKGEKSEIIVFEDVSNIEQADAFTIRNLSSERALQLMREILK